MLVMVRGIGVGLALGASMLMVVACGAAPDGREANDDAVGFSASAMAREGSATSSTTTASKTASSAASTVTQKAESSTTPATTGTATLGSGTLTVTPTPTPIFTLQPCERFASWLVQVRPGTICSNVKTGDVGTFIGQSGSAWIGQLAEYYAHMILHVDSVATTDPAFLAWAKSTVLPALTTFDPFANGASFCQYWWRSVNDANDGAYASGYGSTPSEHAYGQAHVSLLTSGGQTFEETCVPHEIEEVGDNGCVTYGNHPSCMGCAMVW